MSRVQRDAPLAPLTTFKVGGPADWLVHAAHTRRDHRRASRSRATHGHAVTVLGGGSNVLVSDAGVRGSSFASTAATSLVSTIDTIRADGGVTINGLVRWTINHGVAGLEAGPARRARSAARSTATRISGDD